MADVFISYAKTDRPLALKLAAMLEAEGWKAPPRAITLARIVVFMAKSSHSPHRIRKRIEAPGNSLSSAREKAPSG